MKHTILIVDDEPDYCDMLRMRLETHDFRVVTAADGVEGLEKARSELPDLILLDVMLPGLDGGDVAHKLRADPALSKIPVLFLTAAISAVEADRRWGSTEERFLSKTMDHKVILKRIRESLTSTAVGIA
jgi:DNA-binding response OmpR family regulator